MRIDAVIQMLAALVVGVSASPISTTSNHVVHERRSVIPPNWSRHSRLHPAVTFPVRIGLAQQNLHRAEEFINQVAHPASTQYGQVRTQFLKAFYPSSGIPRFLCSSKCLGSR
jgi:tripeptidyl-peptidase I